MTKKLRYLFTLLLMMVASGVWAEDIPFYTLDTSNQKQTSNNNYNNTYTISINDFTWYFTGNMSTDTWRVGGKSITDVDRIVYTGTTMSETTTKLVLSLSTGGGIALNSLKLTVASDAEFSNVIDEVTKTNVNLSGDNEFTPSTGKVWTKGAYYKFTFNVTVSGSSNKYIGFDKVVFYKAPSAGEKIDPTVAIGAETIEIGGMTTVSSNGPTFSIDVEDDNVVTVNSDLEIIGVGAGSTTITVSWEGDSQFNGGTVEFVITVIDPNAPGTVNKPFTVEQAIAFINTLGENVLSNREVYVSGIVSQVDQYVGNKYITYWISDDGTTTTQLEVYKGLGLEGAAFTAITDLGVGDKVTVCGKVKLYKNNSGTVIIPEFDADNRLVSFEGITRIVADDVVSLEYDDTSGEIAFSVLNQGSISMFTVELEAGCDWISDINYVTSPITFKTTVNNGGADRSATITLHHNGAEDKVVTVTQKCNPENVKMVIEEEDKITFSFNTNNKWDFPTDPKGIDEAEFTADGYTIKVAGSTGNGYKDDNNVKCLLLGKEGAYLSLPAFSFPVSKIEVEGNSGASGKVTQNIFVDDEAVSTQTTGAAETNTYEIPSDNQAAGTIYTLKVTNEYNTQITKIIVYKGEESGTISTGINNIEQTIGDAAIYNLNGVRVNKVQKGVYVVNGKKVVIK